LTALIRRALLIGRSLLIRRALLIGRSLPIGWPLLLGLALLILLLGLALLILLLALRLVLTLLHLLAVCAHLLMELILLIARQNTHELPAQLTIRFTVGRASLGVSLRVLIYDRLNVLLLVA
jgi:hypothetical protein